MERDVRPLRGSVAAPKTHAARRPGPVFPVLSRAQALSPLSLSSPRSDPPQAARRGPTPCPTKHHHQRFLSITRLQCCVHALCGPSGFLCSRLAPQPTSALGRRAGVPGIRMATSLEMQALLEYVQSASIPRSERPNVSSTPVQSVTLGMVSQRQHGFGISAATTAGKLRLLQALIAFTEDLSIAGCAPESYTSICLNVDFASGLHTDRYNSGDSWVAAVGDFQGGELFVEKASESERERSCALDHESSCIDGVSVGVRERWYRFDGSRRHCTMGYEGFRVSVVCFSVPIEKCCPLDLARLRHLGFKIPRAAPFSAFATTCPYQVFVCSTRRSQTVGRDTLTTLLSDKSLPPDAVTLCVADEEDVEQYRPCGLRMIASEQKHGLPEQRSICTRYLPRGSWCLFLDDDVTSVARPDHLSLHELVMLGFLTAQQRHVHLWGLNTSANPRSLRDSVSMQLGLVNGYFFGEVTHPELLRDATRTSDAVCGAGEDIERSVRCFVHSGIVRLNFAAAGAKTKCNAGGLQHHYKSIASRLTAHEYVVRSLCEEFPSLVRIAPGPNGIKFTRSRAREEEEEEREEDAESLRDSSQCGDVDQEDAVSSRPLRTASAERREESRCNLCGLSYARKEDLVYHIQRVHDACADTVACPLCSRAFRKRKDMLTHVRMRRCHSKRGRRHGATAGSNLGGERCHVPASAPPSSALIGAGTSG